MLRTVWHSIAVVLGTSLVAGAFLAQPASPLVVSAEWDDAAAWAKLRHPSMTPHRRGDASHHALRGD